MSIGSEMWCESKADAAYHESRAEQALADKLWLTRDGRVIPVREMTDGHLANSINMLRRGGEGCFGRLAGDALGMLVEESERRKAVKR